MKFGPNTIANALKFPAKPTKFFHKGKKMVAMVDIQTTLFVTEKWLMFPKYFTFPKSTVSNLWCSSFLELATTLKYFRSQVAVGKNINSMPC